MNAIDIQTLLGPNDLDVKYTQEEQLRIGLILRMDSYKFAHPFAYDDGITAMSSYGCARVDKFQIIIPFGVQLLAKRYLTQRIIPSDVDAAEAFSIKHFGRKLFSRETWDEVVKLGGHLPLTIRAVPEGTPVHGGDPIYSVTAFGKLFFWMSAGFETLIQRGVWYPTTIATLDREIKIVMKKFYENTGADLAMLPFALHDFGGRGVTCGEQAEIGGCAHTANFMGSDTIEGILTSNFYYKEEMAAYSVYATEHSVECSFGGGTEDALRYIRKQLANTPEGCIVSIVIDGYDVYREAELVCTVLKNEIIASKTRVVLRPDSGDMMVVVPRLLRLIEATFGFTENTRGFKKVNTVGIIQGDGVDHLAIKSLLGHLMAHHYAADNIIFGSGGALLQKVNRDTFKFAQKASAIYRDDQWVGIAKNPITDPGKKSKEGVLTLVRSKMTNELMTMRLDQGPLNAEFEDIMVLVYHNGDLYNETTLAEIRARCAI